MNVTTQAVFAKENLDTFWRDALPLLTQHWREVATYPEIPLDVDIERYRQVEAIGMVRIFTARFSEQLVGYAVFFVNLSMHYKSSLQATSDVIFVDPEWRKGSLGVNLLKFAHSELEGEGVQVIYHHVKAKHPQLGALLEHLGFIHDEFNYSKRLA